MGTLLVTQSGGPTPVINRSLYGVVTEALKSSRYDQVLGARHSVDGIISGEFVDLTSVTSDRWSCIKSAPGSAIGTSRRKLVDADVPMIWDRLDENSVTCWVMIGGNDSAENALTISTEAATAGYDLLVVHVPKTVDNDLAESDHSPGYGSAARFVAAATLGAGFDAESMGRAAPITVLEVAGRNSGWLAAAGALSKRDERDAPHVVVLPEIAFDEEGFVAKVEEAFVRYGYAIVVAQENVRSSDGGPLGGDVESTHQDAFGHQYYEGAGRYLTKLLTDSLGVRVRYDKPGTIQRSLPSMVSNVDAEEAELVGRAAVSPSWDRSTGGSVVLIREQEDPYRCTTGVTSLDKVAGISVRLPSEFIDDWMVTPAFKRYATPLIGEPLPQFGRL